ncbi:GvpL/GvpF family gas vesicle protein [Xanthobacter sediminis]
MTGLLVFAVVPADRIDPALLAGGEGLPTGLRFLTAGALAAVVGAAPEGGLKGQDRGALLPWLLASQKVMEHLLAHGPVLPAALGTVVEDDGRLRHLLERGAGALHAAFEALEGGFEMDLSVRWSLDAVVARCLDAIAPEMRAAAEAGDEAARRALGAALGARVAAERGQTRQRVAERLHDVARDMIVSEPAEPEGVASLALLVERGAEAALDDALEALDMEFGGALTFRLVGPLAPYSFASVQVHLAPAEAVRDARAELGVAPDAGSDAVKAAYRRALRRLHPDLASQGATAGPAGPPDGEDGADTAGFLAVCAAYRVLQAEEAPVSLRRQEPSPPE